MKKALTIIMRSFVVYLVFVFFVIVLVMADFRGSGHFRFWDGEEMSHGQEVIFYFVQCILVMASGISAFKAAKHDWKLWKKIHDTRLSKEDRMA
jgi:hypothetical protein